MDSLINFDGLGDVIVNLTNKFADGVGWIADKETPKKLAINTYIKEIQEKDYDPLIKAALISNAKQTIKGYCNQNDIVKIAIQSLQNKSEPEKVEDDWLAQFMDKAKLVSDKDFQYIWGRILAEECNSVNSIPRSLLNILLQMDKNDAIVFSAISSVSIYVENKEKEFYPIIIASYLEDFYKELGITYDYLINLQALGLIEVDMESDDKYWAKCEKTPVVINYHDSVYKLPENMNPFRLGNVIFTKAGNALCNAIYDGKQEGFLEKYCIPFWEKDE